MCGRFTSLTPPEELARLFDADIVDEVRSEEFRQNFNVAPSMSVLAVASTPSNGRRIGRLRWGLVPEWSKEATGTGHVNARSETISDKPSFRESFQRRRCIIPMSGYYEWRTVGVADSRTSPKTAVYVTHLDGSPLAVAGIWSAWTDGRSVAKTCCVVTRAADELLATVHDRMPVILEKEHWSAWLGEGDVELGAVVDILRDDKRSQGLAMKDVGSLVNNVRNNGPELIGLTD